MVFHWLWDLVVRISANSVVYFMMHVTEWDLFIDCNRAGFSGGEYLDLRLKKGGMNGKIV
jgi:hypothetical protein